MNSPKLYSILLVDDDEISNLFNKIFIGKLNLKVDVKIALNGKEALDLLMPSEIDLGISMPCLLLLDIRMPTMNGWEFLKAYEEKISEPIRNNITIVMLTTSADEGDMVKALNTPSIKEFMQKPLSEKIIRKIINKYFSQTKIDS